MKEFLRRAKRRFFHPPPDVMKSAGLCFQLRNTVICCLSGGLANQMICYKLARYITHTRKMCLMIDATGYEYDAECGNRNLQLLFHDVEYSSVIHSQILRDAILAQNAVLTFPSERYSRFHDETVQQELFEILGANKRGNVLVGLWEGLCLRRIVDQYFRDVGINKELRFDQNEAFDEPNETFASTIRDATNSVAIHVRRGDFATHDGGMLISKQYYNEAIHEMEQRLLRPTFFVFSDEITWCRENLTGQRPIHFADFNDERNGFKDLALGALCNHFILSHESTYSHMMLELSHPVSQRIVIRNGKRALQTFNASSFSGSEAPLFHVEELAS
ncbi:MAG TPA: alpha-1,2-fucosyltransferase [Planctomycetaceae bacterium]|nr:alpha-1,2-fucosyltransferase [Planctomycetaceae bacterium]